MAKGASAGRIAGLLLGVLAAAVACAAEPSGPAAEPSVRPGANDAYLAPDLDVEAWIARFEGETREIFLHRRALVAALGLEPGAVVADVGAGTGLFMEPLAAGVGAAGRVYAVEISPAFLAHLRKRASQEGLVQVEVVAGKPRSLELPDDSIDLALVCDVYHHFEYPRSMLASLRRALRPGGALVVIDFERIPGRTRPWVLGHVRAGKHEIAEEIEEAGFVLEREVPVAGLVENYVLRFRNP